MRYLLHSTLFLLLTVSCTKQVQHTRRPAVIGHGGIGNTSSLPMNSLESILASYYSGADGCELDLQLSADGKLIAFHAQDLSENTNLEGMVNDLSWEELSKGYYRENPYLNYALVSLEQVLTALQNTGALNQFLLSLDCKLYNNQVPDFKQKYAEALLRIIQDYNLENNVAIENANPDFLNIIRNANSNIALFLYTEVFEEGIDLCDKYGFKGISISTRNITKEEISLAHEKNLEVTIWNVHDRKDNRDAVKKEADYIQTEQIKYLLKLLS